MAKVFERAHDFHVNSLVVNEPPSVNALESQSIYLVVLYFNPSENAGCKVVQSYAKICNPAEIAGF
jgi:hypothetical protein